MHGRVRAQWRNAEGHTIEIPLRPNQLTYACADVLAELMAGHQSYRPIKMGFVYGTISNPTLLAPTNRNQTWNNIASELADIGNAGKANMQISPFSLPPVTSVDGDEALYTGNSVTYSAITQSGTGTYGFPLGSTYADVLADGNYIYHAVLLAEVNYAYIPVARVTLAENDVFLTKPAGYELALFWQISFF